MSPILVRPVREQLEHDRIIRLLQTRLKRRHDVAVNVGDEQTAGVRVGVGQMFPDLVLTSQDRGKRLEGLVEVETGESVNHLEAMAQWAHFGRVRAPFHLYVPAVAVEIARRLCVENQVNVAELWSFHTIADQTRFTLVQRSASAPARAESKAPARAESKAPVRAEPKAPARAESRAPARAESRAPARAESGAPVRAESRGQPREVPAEPHKPAESRKPGSEPRKRPAAAARKADRPARKPAPAARGAKPRSGRPAAAARKNTRTQKRK